MIPEVSFYLITSPQLLPVSHYGTEVANELLSNWLQNAEKTLCYSCDGTLNSFSRRPETTQGFQLQKINQLLLWHNDLFWYRIQYSKKLYEIPKSEIKEIIIIIIIMKTVINSTWKSLHLIFPRIFPKFTSCYKSSK